MFIRVFVLSLWLMVSVAAAHDEAPELTVATVNGEKVSLNLVSVIISQLSPEIRRQPISVYYDQVVDDIINTKLLASVASTEGMEGDPLLAELVERASEQVLAEAWLNRVVRERVTPSMIDARYEEIVANTEGRMEIRARHILVPSREEAEAAIVRLDGGADFAELAQELSEGPSGENGGELGYFGRGSMVPPFEEASFALKKGTHSATPIETQFGWHVIKVEDRRVKPAPELASVREEIINSLSVEQARIIIAEMRKGAEITRLSLDEVREHTNASSAETTQ